MLLFYQHKFLNFNHILSLCFHLIKVETLNNDIKNLKNTFKSIIQHFFLSNFYKNKTYAMVYIDFCTVC